MLRLDSAWGGGNDAGSPADRLMTLLRRMWAAALVVMLAMPAYADSNRAGGGAARDILPRGPAKARLDDRERALHLLNRFTFGPTPETVAQVEAIGVKRWFEEQLAPAKLQVTAEDRYLTARLSQFPALQMPVEELLIAFPNGAEIRQTADGKRPMPTDPTQVAIYRRHIDLYRDKQAEKAAAAGRAEGDAAGPAGEVKARKDSDAQSKGDMAMGARGEAGVTAGGSQIDKQAYSQADKQSVNQADKVAEKQALTQANELLVSRRNALTASLLGLAPDARVKQILTMPAEDYRTLYLALKQPQRMALMADLSAPQREVLEDYENPTRTVVEEVQSDRLLRDIYSSHQLQEVMTTFWLNHFNVYIHKNEQTPYLYASYVRDVIGPRALGNFEDLLTATAKSPLMLMYLDNDTSTGPDSPAAGRQRARIANGNGKKVTPPGLNENYARELMELHTLGVNGGYTQKDVTEVARVFTGWTVGKKDNRAVQSGQFRFDESRHEPGAKTVLGRHIAAGGEKEGLEVLHMLATSPATAHFLCSELATEFVSDAPPASLVNLMAKTFLSTHGEIAAVLRVLVNSKEFWAADTYQAKVKTPLGYVVSAARASHAEITNVRPLIGQLNQMGMPLFACVPPTGYSSQADAWVSTGALVTRMNFSLSLASNHFPGISTNWPAEGASNPAAAERALEVDLMPGGVSDRTRNAILVQAATENPAATGPGAMKDGREEVAASSISNSTTGMKAAPVAAAPAWQNVQLAGLLLGSPEFQRR